MESETRTISAAIIENGRQGEIFPVDLAWTGENCPLVSCLMISRGHLFPARFAIECFQNQSYENCELIIVIDNPACELIPYVANLKDVRIRLVEVTAGKTTLGELRNISVASARGDYVCQWDDDDLYAPERIQIQLAAMLTTQVSACVLRRWTLWWPEAKRVAISGARLWEGSILALRRVMAPYPAARRGEDTEMMESLIQSERVLSLEAPDLYVYIYHGSNTFSQQHYFNIYNFSRRRWVNNTYWEKLDSLSRTVPIREYLEALPDAEKLIEKKSEEAREFPLVSIIVRSMGRPELRRALESLAAQDYPKLDVIIVDATGGYHPPLPEIVWRSGHEVRMIGGHQRLPRPQAANAGLDAVRGEWFGFLDDDDSFDADHVSALVRAASATDKLLVYGLARFVDIHGETKSLYGFPFNRAIMFYGPLLYFQAALIRREVLGLGCRFDERFEISEDRDFCAQIAEHSDFEHIRHVSFNYGVELGTSGTGQGNGRDTAKIMRFEQLLRYKWFGAGCYHTARAVSACKNGVDAYIRGDIAEARQIFDAVLREYPDDQNAMAGLGYIALMDGDLDNAELMLRRAVEINPAVGEPRLHLAATLERAGLLAGARKEAWRAASDPRVREAAQQLLSRLGGAPPQFVSKGHPEATRRSRMGSCPCGSGKRYKHCCGQLATTDIAGNPLETEAQLALAAFHSGDAFVAIETVTRLSPADLTRADTALACGAICSEMAHYEEAYAFFRRAADLGETTKAAEGVTRACQQWYKSERDAPARHMVIKLAERFNSRTQHAGTVGSPEIHIIASLKQLGGSEHRALGLFAQLSRHARVRIWSTVPPLPGFADRFPVETIDEALGHYPISGHFVFVGSYFEYGRWLRQCRVDRITICYNIDAPASLIERLVEIEEVPIGFFLDFTFPSRQFRDAVGIGGCVDYSVVDVGRFNSVRTKSSRSGPMVIGRHSRDDRLKFHPTDPAFFRRLAGLGHQVMITGGTCLERAVTSKGQEHNVTLLPETQTGLVEFLDGLDCFIYRIHPHFYETGGTVILEAMAMSLPVVLFNERVGMVEVIEHGRNGFVVETEEEAVACIGQLARDPDLRRRIGEAARATLISMMEVQTDAMLNFYLHVA